MKRPKPYVIAWPVQQNLPEPINSALARQFSNADQMFEILFRDFGGTKREVPALTQGAIPFGDAAGTVTQDPALNYNATTKRLTARLDLPAGTATAGTAPAKFAPGTLLGAVEIGALEFVDDGTTGHLYITVNVAGVATRVQIV